MADEGLHLRSWSVFLGLFLSGILVLYICSGILSELQPPRRQEPGLELTAQTNYLSTMSRSEEDKWRQILETKPIKSIVTFPSALGGLGEKYWVTLEDEYIAVAKPAAPYTLFSLDFPVVSFQSALLDDAVYPRRVHRTFQGWSEVGASAVASLAFPGMKPPSVMREVSSSKLYMCNGCGTWKNFFAFLFLPEHPVLVSLTPWLGKIEPWFPSTEYWKYLIGTHLPVSRKDILLSRAAQISDVLIFDYLLDDHDRQKNHNWVTDGTNLLLWDSGLAWAHGPAARTSCFDLLCGPEKWKSNDRHLNPMAQQGSCTPICKFRNSTISLLRSMGPTVAPADKLGARVQKSLEGQLPVFENAVFYMLNFGYPKIQFELTDFYVGLDHRVAKLLSHVDSCIAEYGEQYVLDDFERFNQ